MKKIRFVTWLALLAAGLGLLAGCLPPEGGASASPAARAPGPTAAAGDTPAPAAGAVTSGMSSAPVSSSLVLTSTASAPLPPLETTGSIPPEVTLADQGRTITMHVGERFLLHLEGGAAWVVEIADPAVLSLAMGTPIASDAQGLFEARKIGATTLGATNEPACRKAQPPCMLPTRAFEAHVVVK